MLVLQLKTYIYVHYEAQNESLLIAGDASPVTAWLPDKANLSLKKI